MRKVEVIERQFGKPIVEVLKDAFSRYQTQQEVAKALGVTQGTVSLWLRLNNLEAVTIVREQEARQ